MKTGIKNLLWAVGVIIVLAAIIINSNIKHVAFVEKFDYQKARASGLPMLVEFGFQACPPCKMMKPVLKSLDKEYSDKFAIGYIDTMTKENQEMVMKYGIEAAPTLIFFDKDGKELGRLVGYTPKEEILDTWKKLGIEITGK